ncbi:MAG: sporulation protein YunB [Clostridia bacterium]|nr:sporulation protein YunB [Clostridia bacterium]
MRRGFRARHRINSFTLWLLLILAVLLLLFAVFNMQLLPVMKSLALNKASITAVAAMNNAVGKVLSEDGESIDDLVTFQKDDSGNITAVQSNPYTMNKLKYDVILETQKELGTLTESSLSIPLGTVLGGPVFTNRGPKLAVKLSPFGSITAEYSSVFSSAGINQTRLQIMLNVKTTVSAIIASCTAGTEISSSFCVAETVIVGSVPQTYLDTSGGAGGAAFILGSSSSASSK